MWFLDYVAIYSGGLLQSCVTTIMSSYGQSWNWNWSVPQSQQSQGGSWAWKPAGGASPNGQPSWKCSNCAATNWAPKNKCSQCGMRKNWQPSAGASSAAHAHTANGPANGTPHPAPQHLVAQGLAACLDKLHAASGPMPPSPFIGLSHNADAAHGNRSPTPFQSVALCTAPPPIGSFPANGTPEVANGTRAESQATIKSLESAMAALGDGEATRALRDSMTAQVVALKRQLQVQKPMGQRLDNARAAHGRAAKRLEQANLALCIAQETVQIASSELSKISSEVLELEASIGGESVAASGGDSMVGLKENLSSMVNLLATMDGVSEGTTADAIAWSEATMAKFQATFSEAAKHMAVTAATVKRRHSAKTGPNVGSDVGKLRRTIGKHTDVRTGPPKKPSAVGNHFETRVPGSDDELLLDALDLSSGRP